jgi:hypothetical protein
MQDTKSVPIGLPAELSYIIQYFSKPIALHAICLFPAWLIQQTKPGDIQKIELFKL